MPSEADDVSRMPPSRSLYDRDFAAWVEQQVLILRSGQTASLDVANLIQELEGLTKRDERALGSQLKRIMTHSSQATIPRHAAAARGRL